MIYWTALFTVVWETGFITDMLTVPLFTVASERVFITDILDCTAFYSSEGDRIYY
jgi:hypothetical protein